MGTPNRRPAAARRTISATTAAKGLGALVDKVRERRETYVIERGGVPVATIGPVQLARCTVADLVEHLRRARSADEAFAREVRAGAARLNRPAVPGDPWAS